MGKKIVFKSKALWLVLSFFFVIFLGYGKDVYASILNVSLEAKSLNRNWWLVPHLAAWFTWFVMAAPIFYKKELEDIKTMMRFTLFPIFVLMTPAILQSIAGLIFPFSSPVYSIFYSSPLMGDISYLKGFITIIYLCAAVPTMYFTYGKDIGDQMLAWILPLAKFIASVIMLFVINTLADTTLLWTFNALGHQINILPYYVEIISDSILVGLFLYFQYMNFKDKFHHLWYKILVGLIVGVFLGDTLRENASMLEPVGEIFIRLIKMLVVPLILSSMTVGIASIHDPKKLGRVGLKTLTMYLITTAISICIGLVMAYIISPGDGIQIDAQVNRFKVAEETPKLSNLIVQIVPENPAEALASGNVLQIIVFSLFLGFSIILIGEQGRPLHRIMESLSETMYRMTSIIMEAAPFGVCAIMAGVTGKYGLETVLRLMSFLACNYLCFIIQIVFVFGFILRFIARLDLMKFLKGMRDAIALAFSTSSSSGTLPVSLHCVQENLGVSRNIANFVLPLGSTVNMNGAAIGQAVAAVFVAQVYGIELSWQNLAVIVVTATLSAIGAAGIPSTGIVMLSVVLSSVGLPTGQVIGMLYGVDRIREMGSTVVNILGDSVVAVTVAKAEGELDEEQYNCAEHISVDDSDV